MKRQLCLLMTVVVCGALVLAACSPVPAAVEKTVFVGPTLVDCEGAGAQKCLLVKENPDEEFSLFYDQIEGFDYEEGYEYELRIREEKVQDPPADASAIKWTLVEVVSKTLAAAPLEGTRWSLVSYVNKEGELVSVLPDAEITLMFESGEVKGSAGCNSYFGPYEVDDGQMTIGLLGATQMMCPGPIMQQEAAYLAALQSTASYQVEGDRLEIADSSGKTILVFGVLEPMLLTGTTWQMMGYNNGREAMVSALAGTEITALFGDDGTLTGSAGCNNYTASYEVSGGGVTVGPAATTRMMCAEPEGIMEQEAAYLAALESAASYSVEGDQLELMDTEGRRAVSYIAAPEKGTGLTEEALSNAVYRLEWTESGLAPLADGEYREQAAPGSATEIVVKLAEHIAFGELGGQDAAAVILVTDPGGSGTFYNLAVVVEEVGQPVHMATTLMGDRVQINSLSIQGGEIVVDMITHGSDDPMCCPTQHVVQTFELRDGQLVQTSGELISAASGSEIVGVVWRWVKFLGGDGTTIIVDDPDKYTLELLPDGMVRIQADCNSASGSYTLDAAGGLTLELGPTTLAECEAGSVYDEYLEMLGWVRTYVLEGDQLVLNMMADGGDLFFERAGASAAA